MHHVPRKSSVYCSSNHVKDPYRVNKPEHSKQVYGKALPIHFERNDIQADGLMD